MRNLGELATKVLTAAVTPQRPLPQVVEQPPLLNRLTDYDIPARVWSNWKPDHGPREIVRALTATERAALQRRAYALETGLHPFVPGEADLVDSALHGMLSGFRALARQQGADADASVDVLRVVLRKFPAWAIVEGALRIARGEADLDRRYAPNDCQVCADVVAKIVAPYRKNLESAMALLAATVEASEDLRPAAEEIAAKLGRPVGERPTTTERPPELPGDGKHAQRVEAALAERRARQQAAA